jgi:tRNA splicing endonuclease
MVDYIQIMPYDIQEMIYANYFRRHVLSQMIKVYFPHMSCLKTDKKFDEFMKKCINEYKVARRLDKKLTSTLIDRLYILVNKNLEVRSRSDKYETFIDILNFLTESSVILGMFYTNIKFKGCVYDKLNSSNYTNQIHPRYYILLFNVAPKTTNIKYKGCC